MAQAASTRRRQVWTSGAGLTVHRSRTRRHSARRPEATHASRHLAQPAGMTSQTTGRCTCWGGSLLPGSTRVSRTADEAEQQHVPRGCERAWFAWNRKRIGLASPCFGRLIHPSANVHVDFSNTWAESERSSPFFSRCSSIAGKEIVFQCNAASGKLEKPADSFASPEL
jgi:hypothetical protein